MSIYNIFNRAAGRAYMPSVPSLAERMMLMNTYEEFMIIIAVAGLIVSILDMKNKK